jgi:hypothetical protein
LEEVRRSPKQEGVLALAAYETMKAAKLMAEPSTPPLSVAFSMSAIRACSPFPSDKLAARPELLRHLRGNPNGSMAHG